jgi:hypothetical protein
LTPAEPLQHRTFSEVLEDLGVGGNPSLTLDEVVEAFGDRGIGALILVLSLMALIPWPPGGKAVFAAPIILLAVELAFQRNEVWLPRWILKASLSRATYHGLISTPFAAPGWLRRGVLTRRFRVGFGGSARTYLFAPAVRRLVRRRPRGLNLIRLLRAAENLTRPRLSALTGPISEILMGVACVLLALMMALPIPFGDMLPGLAMVFFALGIMQKDGVSVLIGAFWTVVSGGYLFLIWATVVQVIQHTGIWIANLFG